jgi:hypothetical protein
MLLIKGCSEQLQDRRITGCALQIINYSTCRVYNSRNIQFGTSTPQAPGHMDQFQDKAMVQSPCEEGCEAVVCRVWEEQAA